MKVQDILTDERKWLKGTLHCNDAHCLIGAIMHAYKGNAPASIATKVREHLHITSILAWNDAPERTFPEVRALIEELDI